MDDRLALALSEWQRKHRIADGDPMVAVLDLVRLALQHPPQPEPGAVVMPPTFEEFRATMELLDARSKTFVTQSTTVIGELRTFAQAVHRMNDHRAGTLAVMVVVGLAGGLGLGWFIWR